MTLPLSREQQALRGKPLEQLTVPQLRVWIQGCDRVVAHPGLAAKARRTWEMTRTSAIAILSELVPSPEWQDAWILLALSRTQTHRPDWLGHLIADADAIQHTIPAYDELNASLGRLAGYRLIAWPLPSQEPNALTPHGMELLTRARSVGDGWLRQQHRLFELLEVECASADGPRRVAATFEGVSSAAYQDAVRAYQTGRLTTA